MAKPIIKTITPFDANTSKMIGFVWTGAMPYTNRMIIYDAVTMLSVYDHTYDVHYKLDHEIPAGILRNGNKYAVQVAVLDKNGVSSDFSDKQYFNVIATPTFRFKDLVASENVSYNTNLVENQSYTAHLEYSQTSGETIASYQFFMYDTLKTELDASDVYNNPNLLEYTYRSLESNTSYYLRATGVTKSGMSLDTGYVRINVVYVNPTMYALLYTDVNDTVGSVDYSSNIVDIESDRPSDAYELDEGYVNLTGADSSKTITIEESSPMLPNMVVDYIDFNDQPQVAEAANSSSVTVSGFSKISDIVVMGKTVVTSEPYLSYDNYRPGSYGYVESFNMQIGRTIVSDATNGVPLMSLSKGGLHDELVIDGDGNRFLRKSVNEIKITSDIEIMGRISGRNILGRNVYGFAFYVPDILKRADTNLICNALPVRTPYRGSYCVTGVRGAGSDIEIVLDSSEFNINSYDDALEWIYEHNVTILYPLNGTVTTELSPVDVSEFVNVNSIRYSKNFKIPADTTTISIRMREAFKTCEGLKLQNDDGTTLILSSTVYEDGTLRYKLSALSSVSNYIIYSDALTFHSWDVVTVHIRRVNGVYGLYVFITVQEPDPMRNMWFLDGEPSSDDTQRGDLWLNLSYPTTYINKDMVVRFYQDNEPSGAEKQNIWIGE